jgi:hypothetical protein
MQLAHELCDLFFRSKLGATQHFQVILGSEVGTQHQQPGQVEFARGDCVEQAWEGLNEACCTRSACGCILRHPQLVNTIRIEAGAGTCAMNASRFHLG